MLWFSKDPGRFVIVRHFSMRQEERFFHGGAGHLRINSVQAESHCRQQPLSAESTTVRPRDRLANVTTIQALILRANNALFPANRHSDNDIAADA
jgi:hypothetical protein